MNNSTPWRHPLVSLEHLRAAVLHRSAERPKQFARLHEGCRAEVNQFDVERLAQDDILILDVTMQDVEVVEVGHG